MILAIAGSIGSGKTTLARALASALGAKHAGFGEFVRALLTAQGLDSTDRQLLQDLGHDRVEHDAAAFLSDTLVWAGHQPEELLVLDGLRHVLILRALQARMDQEDVQHIFLDTPLDERERRLALRGVTAEALAAADAHPAEADLVALLRRAADLVLDGRRPTEALVEDVLAWRGSR
jgi:dephospho-CoA kinase